MNKGLGIYTRKYSIVSSRLSYRLTAERYPCSENYSANFSCQPAPTYPQYRLPVGTSFDHQQHQLYRSSHSSNVNCSSKVRSSITSCVVTRTSNVSHSILSLDHSYSPSYAAQSTGILTDPSAWS